MLVPPPPTTAIRYPIASWLTRLTAGYLTVVKEVSSSRGGAPVTLVQHGQASSDKDEPRSYSGSTYSRK